MLFPRVNSRENALLQQTEVRRRLLAAAAGSRFANDHGLSADMSERDYAERIPLRKYEDFQPYWDRLAAGELDVFRRGFPEYFGLSSGTTSGSKKIPLYREQIRRTISRTSHAFFHFLWNEKTVQPLSRKLFYLSAPAELSRHADRPTALLSALTHHELPALLHSRRLPSLAANQDPNRAERRARIVAELLEERVSFFSGTPPWMLDLLDECERAAGRPLPEIFPSLHCFGSGGTAMAPYRSQFERRFPGRALRFFETFAATEGLVGYRPRSDSTEYALDTKELAYEFVPYRELTSASPRRLTLEQVETGEDYALVLSNDSGLFGYVLGDVIRFVCTDPFRFVIRGRTESHLNRYGEHLLGSELENAVQAASRESGWSVCEFSALDSPEGYSLYCETTGGEESAEIFARLLDEKLCAGNPLFSNARRGGIAHAIRVEAIERGSFLRFLERRGKAPGQTKVPRILSREDEVKSFLETRRGAPLEKT